MANKIAKTNIKEKQKYLKFIRNEKRENAIKINFKNTKYTHAVCIFFYPLWGGKVCVDRALMWHELNCLLQSTLRPTGRMIDAVGRNKKKGEKLCKTFVC